MTLARCVESIAAAADPPDEIIVVEEPARASPATARNAGARRTDADILVFVDSDVVVHGDLFTRIRAAFDDNPSLTAVFGSYDDSPPGRGVVSAFRNLLHHHVHQTCAGPAMTFWSGIGAIRREAFLKHGGFDTQTYPRPSIEDIEFGNRLTAAGERVELDPALQGTHLKEWTLRSMVMTDFFDRGLPWVALLLRTQGVAPVLNLGWRHRVSALAAVAGAASLVTGRPRGVVASLAALIALNHELYRLLLRRRGPAEAAAGVGLHALHHLTAAAAVPTGLVVYAVKAARNGRPSGAGDRGAQ